MKNQPRTGSLRGVLLAVGVCSFMSALNGSIVNAVLPVIARGLGAELVGVQWVVITFLLVVSGLMLSFGRLGDIVGHKKVFLSGFAVFILAAGFCGAAGNLWTLVAGRGLQGLGAAMVFANTVAILTRHFPPEKRGRALGFQAGITYLGLTLGPILGGWLAEEFTWRATFWINVPVGVVAWGLSYLLIPKEGKGCTEEPFDWPGSFVFVAGLVAFLLALNKGHAIGWGSPTILGLLVLASLLLGAFRVIERRTAQPMLDLSLFQCSVFSSSVVAALLNYICLYSVTFLMPFYLIQARGYSPSKAGALITALPLLMAASAPLSGILSDRRGFKSLSALGMAIMALGLILLGTLGAGSSEEMIMLAHAVTGLGTGIFITPNNNALMGAAPAGRQGVAAGVLATARNVGMMLGIALSGAVFSTVKNWTEAGDPIGASIRGIRAAQFLAAGLALLGGMVSLLGKAEKARGADRRPDVG